MKASTPFTARKGGKVFQDYHDEVEYDEEIYVTLLSGLSNLTVPDEFLAPKSFYHPTRLIEDWDINDVSF